jgi:SAM-dependent methyltransferase
MSGYGIETYGDRVAERYDELHAFLGDPTPCVDFLAALAGKGPALELGIGTGRIALPLAARGVAVHGIDSSKKMVAKLRAKKGGRKIPVTVGDFVTAPVKGRYPLVYVVFNTFFGLQTQDDQVRCFERVATRLAPGGTFVLECFVPDRGRFDHGQRTSAFHVDSDAVGFTAETHDAVTQQTRATLVLFEGRRTSIFPVRARYAWPAEMDLMARISGLRLRERWGGWKRTPFTSGSASHVSVYEKPR